MSGARIRGEQIADGSLTTEDIDDSLEKEFTKSRVTTNDSTPNFLSSKIIAGTNVTINVVGVSGSDQILAISSSASGGGGSGISGAIETNEIAFGTSTDTISGSSNLTYDGSKVSISGLGSVLELSDSIDGVFFETNSSFATVSVKDPLGSNARVDISAWNGVIALESEVKLAISEAPSTNRLLSFGNDGSGKTAIKGEITTDGGVTFVPDELRFSGSAWTINGSSGNSGDVLTSNGAGTAPTWETPSGGGGGAASASYVTSISWLVG
jgi:hypothetical protein